MWWRPYDVLMLFFYLCPTQHSFDKYRFYSHLSFLHIRDWDLCVQAYHTGIYHWTTLVIKKYRSYTKRSELAKLYDMVLVLGSSLFVRHSIYTFDFFEMVPEQNRRFGKKLTTTLPQFFVYTFPSMISTFQHLQYASYKKIDIILVISVVHNPYSRIHIFIFIATNAHINFNMHALASH